MFRPIVVAVLSFSCIVAPVWAQQKEPVQPAAQAERVKVQTPAHLKATLDKLGFAAEPHGWEDRLADLYQHWKQGHYPVVVTTDAALHTWHLHFDWYLRFLEIAHLRGDLINLTDALAAKMTQMHDDITDAQTKEAALLGASYFLIGKRLLVGGDTAGAPEPWKGRIEGELELIAEAKDIAVSPLFGVREDYTQYKPRGHYSRSDEFASYFRAMMWYGRMKFRLDTDDAELAKKHTRCALLVSVALRTSKVKGEDAAAVWKRIYETTAFFAGEADDLLPDDYAELALKLAPARPGPVDIDVFIKEARKLRKPRILGTYAESAATTGARPWQQSTQGMTLFGQRSTLDAAAMQRLVFDAVGGTQLAKWPAGEQSPFTAVKTGGVWIRAFPRGLDVMSALGFKQALEIMHKDGDVQYDRYDKNMEALQKELGAVDARQWGSNLYMMRLRATALLKETPKGKLPKAMGKGEWGLKGLAAALGSWTELKHDTILYSKQSYAMAQMALAGGGKGEAAPPPPPPPRGYVEPMPEVYAVMQSSAKALLERVKTLGYPEDNALTGGLQHFAATMASLEAIARKELEGKPLTDGEFAFIENIGRSLQVPRYGLPHHRDVTEEFMTEMDDVMPIVADVHTDVNSQQVLEEAVGRPMVLYMLCPVSGEATVCLGAVYSYYEFKRPMAERMTDEEWRKLIGEGKAPPMPEWMKVYVIEKK